MFSSCCRTPSHLTGLSDRCFAPTLLFSAFYQNVGLLYPENGGFVNRTNCSDGRRHASAYYAPSQGHTRGTVESAQKFRKISKILYFPPHTRVFSVKCLACSRGKSAFFTNFHPAVLHLCKYYKKVAKFRIFGLILRKLSHTIGEQVAKAPLCSAPR